MLNGLYLNFFLKRGRVGIWHQASLIQSLGDHILSSSRGHRPKLYLASYMPSFLQSPWIQPCSQGQAGGLKLPVVLHFCWLPWAWSGSLKGLGPRAPLHRCCLKQYFIAFRSNWGWENLNCQNEATSPINANQPIPEKTGKMGGGHESCLIIHSTNTWPDHPGCIFTNIK